MNEDSSISLHGLSADLSCRYKDTINALRLCHRFGRGPDVHVSKLPRELELAIEQLIITEVRNATLGEWVPGFRCLEGRCAPVDHFYEVFEEMTYDEIFDLTLEEVEPCSDCRQSPEPRQCDFLCNERAEKKMNQKLLGEVEITDFHIHNNGIWQTLYPPGPMPPLASSRPGKLRKLLLRDFGLAINAKWHRQPATSCGTWTDDPNHEWHLDHEMLTIICYLTRPKRVRCTPSFAVSGFEKEAMGFADLSAVQSSFVQIPTVEEQSVRRKQFNLAMSVLGLQPFIHPSQLKHTISADGDLEMHEKASPKEDATANEHGEAGGTSEGDSYASATPQIAQSPPNLERQSWPRLIQIVSATVLLSDGDL
ncbi:hypothetical protein Q7P37_003846 [Cladosporium fusiforme]